MRAYLSGADRFEGVQRLHTQFERAAIREAERILRDAEPAIYYPGHEGKAHLSYTVSTRDYAGYRVACDDLAQALAAFVGE